MRTLFLFLFVSLVAQAKPTVRVASKAFTENFLLGEIIAQIIEETGELKVDRKLGMGDTGIVIEAIKNGSIDFYPDYSGTLTELVLKRPDLSTVPEIRAELNKMGLTITDSLGFNNTYAVAVPEELAKKHNINTIEDLKHHPNLKAGFSKGFEDRADAYPRLRRVYGLDFKSRRTMDHALVYQALKMGEIQIADIFSTDSKLVSHNLRVLEDNKQVFPKYYGVVIARTEMTEKYPKTWNALKNLAGAFTDQSILKLNSRAEIDEEPFSQIAAEFLGRSAPASTMLRDLWTWTKQHISLVVSAVFVAILIGVPLAIVAAHVPVLGQSILLGTGLIQTIPSLALLCLLIQPLGIGKWPAFFALVLYGLLPIVRGTYVGLIDISPAFKEVSRALGLSFWQRLKLIDLPLASRSLMGGIKTSAIITVGTATLAAFIGAGGYGDPIVRGLALSNMTMLLWGAIPAAILALLVHALFEVLDKWVVPKGLQ